MHTLLHDLRYATRQLIKAPAFTTIAVLTLALGIGANMALFTLANAILVRPLPGVRGAESLVWLAPLSTRGGHPTSMSYPDYVDYRDRSGVFSELAAMDEVRFSISSGDEPERVRGQIVTGNYFSVLRTPMALGRGFTPDEDRTPGAHPVVVISHRLWQRRFGGDVTVIGRTLTVNGSPFTIVGVTPERFNGPDHAERRDVWVPTMMLARANPAWPDMLGRRTSWWLRAIGRLKPGVPATRANAAVAAVAAQIARADSAGHEGITGRVFELRSGLTPGDMQEIAPVATLAAAVTALILLIACANVSNLLLGRAVSRRREIGVRLSLGASRARLARQLLTESMLLSALAASLGLLLALWATDLVGAQIPIPLDIAVDARVLAFGVAATVLTGILFGLVPTLHATRGDLTTTLKDAMPGRDVRRSRLQGGFVVAQVSLSLVLLFTAGLFLRGLQKAARMDVGFDATTNVLAASFDLGLQGYTSERSSAFIRTLGERVGVLPGVESFTFTNQVPMGERVIGADISVESDKPATEARFDPRRAIGTYLTTIRPGFFRTLGIPMMRGRDFTSADVAGAPGVAIVSERFARQSWPNEDPIGKRISVQGPRGPFLTVVGVSREALLAGARERLSPVVYLPQLQHPKTMDFTLLVRTSGDARALAGPLRGELRRLDRNLPVYGVQTLSQYRVDRMAELRLSSLLLGVFGALALSLATIGIYGVMAFAVSQRTREIGVRVALGAVQRQVVSLFIGEGLRLTLIGLTIGVGLSLVVARLLSSVFFGIAMGDALTLASVAGLLGLVALLASWIPARRAARVDPMDALRYE